MTPWRTVEDWLDEASLPCVSVAPVSSSLQALGLYWISCGSSEALPASQPERGTEQSFSVWAEASVGWRRLCWELNGWRGAETRQSLLQPWEKGNGKYPLLHLKKQEALGEMCLLMMLLRQPLLVIPYQYSVHHRFLKERHKGTT